MLAPPLCIDVFAVGQRQTFAGPSGPGAARAGWDSTILELRHGKKFILELWTFSESYRVPVQDADKELRSASSHELDSFGRPRASERFLDETRVALDGSVTSGEVPAIKLSGFSRSAANQVFALDSSRLIDGLPTWWSPDGLHFFYFAQEYKHWKLNALKIAGGDGLQAVKLGGKKCGRGYAHSGCIGPDSEEGAEAALLTSGEGWFECIDDEWEPLTPQATSCCVSVLDFEAGSVTIEERTIRGKDSTSERQRNGPLAFRGWCQGDTGCERIRLMLPSVLQKLNEGDMSMASNFVEVDGSGSHDVTVPVGDEGGYRGDPDVVVLEVKVASKL